MTLETMEQDLYKALYLEELCRRKNIPWKQRVSWFSNGLILDLDRSELLDHLSLIFPASELNFNTSHLKSLATAYYADGLRITYPGRPTWPTFFNTIADPPLWLWYKGQPPGILNEMTPVAVVGARQALPYSQYLVKKIVSKLVEKHHPIVSGLARGVDCLAHQSCLHCGGITAAILPCGLTECYPKRHQPLLTEIMKTGFAASEFPPAYPIRKYNFQSRNRLISALSIAVVVVQAGEKSGSLITGRCAAEQDRELWVAPATMDMTAYRGSLRLIAEGANILTGWDDLDHLPQPKHTDLRAQPLPISLAQANDSKLVLKPLEEQIIRYVGSRACQDQELFSAFATKAKVLTSALFRLQQKGLIQRVKGQLLLTDQALSYIYGLNSNEGS